MHNNMITINGTKMGKSLGNFITLEEFFKGSHKDKEGNEMLEQPYNGMTIRFFILMAHYRGTVDFSNEALKAAEKAMNRLLESYSNINRIKPSTTSTADTSQLRSLCYAAMDDDLNTPVVISHLFDAAKLINQAVEGRTQLTQTDIEEIRNVFDIFLFELMGIRAEQGSGSSGAREEAFGKVVDMLLEERNIAKQAKDWATSDRIRNSLIELGFEIKDTKDGSTWKLNK